MASTPIGDIAGARFHMPAVGAHAALASGGTGRLGGPVGPFAFPIRIRNAYWTPTGADNTATSTGTFRRLYIQNGGTSGTATATATATSGGGRMATLGLTASAPSCAPVAMAVDTTVTLATGQVAYFTSETVGGADATNTVVAAGQFSLIYEIL